MPEPRSEKDLTLAPNEFAWVMDDTTGVIKAYTGPLSSSLTLQERAVVFDGGTKRFKPVAADQGKQLKLIAPEGWYVILKNPAKDKRQPLEKEKAPMPDLRVGEKVNIAGPICFSLWPGQMAQVVQGHHLRQDEYLIAKVYDSTAAQSSYDDTVVVTTDPTKAVSKERLTKLAGLEGAPPDALEDVKDDEPPASLAAEKPRNTRIITKEELTTGNLFIIRGTEVSFYMPPSGIEIVKVDGKYIQNAVSLERLEYCLLLDQDGNKRYVQGPKVVFPRPTEDFVSDGVDEDNEPIRKFRAIELGPKQGIYVKVIADYTEDDGRSPGSRRNYKTGEELFITGEETPIYFPREEHLVIKYGNKYTVHCGVAIPAGEARYLLKRLKGEVILAKGPTVLLPDPRHDLIVRRELPEEMCKLLFPGNVQALSANKKLAEQKTAGGTIAAAGAMAFNASESSFMMNDAYGTTGSIDQLRATSPGPLQARRKKAGSELVGNYVDRDGQYVPPRSITLDTKYEGAVTVSVWEGYALMLVNKQGGRRVVQGPQTALLEYDEVPHVMTLSTAKPKTTDVLMKMAYLRTSNNYVTDILVAETSDYVNVTVKLTYRLNFEGDDPKKWFAVENYVKLLCDHMRSIIRNAVRQLTVKEFYRRSTEIIRDLILGVQQDEGPRPGKTFEENGMHVIDVEVLTVKLSDEIQRLMESQELKTIKRQVELDTMTRDLEFTSEAEKLKLEQAELVEATAKKLEDIKRQRVGDELSTAEKEAEAASKKQSLQGAMKLALEQALSAAAAEVRNRNAKNMELDIKDAKERQDLAVALMEADAESTAKKMATMTPNLVAAIQSIGDSKTIIEVAQSMSAQGLLRTIKGESIAQVVGNVLAGTEVGRRFVAGNGASLPAE